MTRSARPWRSPPSTSTSSTTSGRVRGWLAARDGSDAYDEAWTRAAFATDSWVWATAEELHELGEAINALVVEFHASHHEPAPGRESCFVFAHGVPSKP